MTSKTDDIVWARDILRCELEDQAEWRRRKAAEYPDDRRNLDAAKEYKRLGKSVKDIPADLLVAYCEAFEDAPEARDAQSYFPRLL